MKTEYLVFRKIGRNVSSSIEGKLDDAQTNELMLDYSDKSHQSILVSPMPKKERHL